MNIAVAGTGYVGLSMATLLSQRNHVMAMDIVPEKLEKINHRISSIQDEYIKTFGKVRHQIKIFMGDCGSQTIGFILAGLGIRFAMEGNSGDVNIPNALVVAFCVLMIPCLDVSV